MILVVEFLNTCFFFSQTRARDSEIRIAWRTQGFKKDSDSESGRTSKESPGVKTLSDYNF